MILDFGPAAPDQAGSVLYCTYWKTFDSPLQGAQVDDDDDEVRK